jgi:hypothetical protein
MSYYCECASTTKQMPPKQVGTGPDPRCKHGMEMECVECDSDLYLYERLPDSEREHGGKIPYRTDSNQWEKRNTANYMYALKSEMENQGRRDLPNIFVDHVLRMCVCNPELFELKHKLDIINKIWFQVD